MLRNASGLFAAVQILYVEDDSRGVASDALTIRYLILPDGSDNFAAAVGKMTVA